MTPEQALRQLREALRICGIQTPDTDVMLTHSGHLTLSLDGGLLVWCGPERFRWPRPAGGWIWHPISDPAGAAHLLADQLGSAAPSRRHRSSTHRPTASEI